MIKSLERFSQPNDEDDFGLYEIGKIGNDYLQPNIDNLKKCSVMHLGPKNTGFEYKRLTK